MNETTGATSQTMKHITDPFGISKFGTAKMEVPAEFHEMTDKAVAHVRDACAKAKVTNEKAGELLESAYAAAAKGGMQYNLRLIEIARTNTRAAFDCVHELLGVNSPSQFIELSTTHMRRQFDIVSAQNKELCALAQEVATEAAVPIRTGISKAFQ